MSPNLPGSAAHAIEDLSTSARHVNSDVYVRIDGRHDRCGQVAAEIEQLLRSSPYLALRSIRCEYDGTSVILRGRVPTFYAKQVAFTVVERLGINAEIVDQIDVAAPKPRKPRPK